MWSVQEAVLIDKATGRMLCPGPFSRSAWVWLGNVRQVTAGEFEMIMRSPNNHRQKHVLVGNAQEFGHLSSTCNAATRRAVWPGPGHVTFLDAWEMGVTSFKDQNGTVRLDSSLLSKRFGIPRGHYVYSPITELLATISQVKAHRNPTVINHGE